MGMEQTQRKPLWITLLTGFFLGIGAIAPGVSGGAIAVIFGLYDQITDAVANFYKDFWNKMRFLIPLGLGAAAGILLFGHLIKFLFDNYNIQVRCLFIGLMVGTLPSVFRCANKQGFRRWYPIPLVLAAALTISLAFLETLSYSGGETGLSFPLLLLSGAVIGFGTIVPGVSSSFILIAAGLYDPLLALLTDMDIVRLLPVALGFGAFVLLFAKLVNWLYRRAYGLMSYIVCGLLIGSIAPVIPQGLGWNLTTALSVLLGILGCALSWVLLRQKGNAENSLL